MLVLRPLPGVDDAPRHRDQRAPSVVVKCQRRVVEQASLGSDPRHEEQAVRHQGAEQLGVFRIGGRRNRPHQAVPAVPQASFLVGPVVDAFGDPLEDAASFRVLEILEILRRRVRRPHDHEDALPAHLRRLDERLHAVLPEIRVHRRRVQRDRPLGLPLADENFLQMRDGVGFRRRANVRPLHVADHQQALLVRVVRHLEIRPHAGRTATLEVGALEFHTRHLPGDDVNNALAELPCRGRLLSQPPPVRGGNLPDLLRQALIHRVQTDAQGRLFRLDGIEHPVRKVFRHACLLSPEHPFSAPFCRQKEGSLRASPPRCKHFPMKTRLRGPEGPRRTAQIAHFQASEKHAAASSRPRLTLRAARVSPGAPGRSQKANGGFNAARRGRFG